MGDKNKFAQALGFNDWDALMDASVDSFDEGVYTWFLTQLPDGRWAIWDDAELAEDRVSFFATREEAEEFFASSRREVIEDEDEE